MIEIRKERASIEDQIYALEHPEKRALADKFRKANEHLSQQYQPATILCRDSEINQIVKFIREFFETGHSKESLCSKVINQDISGVPGIGKTLSVDRAIAEIKQDRQISKQIQKQKLKIIKLNAMKYKHPSDIYKHLYVQLTPNRDFKKRNKITSHSALITLDGIFRKNEYLEEDQKLIHVKKLVVIDEIDYLKTRDQDVLYNLFDWTQSENSKLAIISISNTINLPQLLKPKIISRIGNRRLIFQHYTSSQLEKILNQRVEQTQIFEKNVINFISKKIAKCSSDIRKCFHILREAILFHTKSFHSFDSRNYKIKLQTVTKAYDAIYSDHFTQIYKNMPIELKRVLIALAKYSLKQSRLMSFSTLYENSLLKDKLDKFEINKILINLMDMGVIQIKHTINPLSNTRFLKQYNAKLLIDYDKVIYASLKYDSEQLTK